MVNQTKEEFIAKRYILLRKQIWLYGHIFLANDSRTNSEIILDRNLSVINAVIPDLWWVLSFSLFQSIFSVLGDLFDVRFKTKGSIMNLKSKSETNEEAISKQLKVHKLGRYSSLVMKLYTARDEFIVHTDKLTEDNFPIKLKDMNRLENFLDELEVKVLNILIKDTTDYYHYKQERDDDIILQQFDHLMNVLYLDYHSFDAIIDEGMDKKRELIISESLKRRQNLLDSRKSTRKIKNIGSNKI